ncbi:hypothetical protein BTN49_1726 [Candidatus Enterovibrio escicola]|uniref:Uncharacterized protein n=1 Tax=Candidatus Enterovibrio escicola TaxID=1927127 RepID=A0A2A5T3N3_9GAMM|nr:hypothetical protein BTN49_1726 [Candidatus Enterovibrio escacola]
MKMLCGDKVMKRNRVDIEQRPDSADSDFYFSKPYRLNN